MDINAARSLWARRVSLAAVLALVVATMLGGAPAMADGHFEVIADDLSNPRHVAVGPGDRLYVAEAGRGGDTLVDVSMSNGTSPICVGETGAITEIRGSRQRHLVDLPSWSGAADGECPGPGMAATGPHGVAVQGRGNLSLTIGLAAAPAVDVRSDITDEFNEGRLFSTAHRLLPSGRTSVLGDLAAFETNLGDDVDPVSDSNAYGISIDHDGSRLVADAGGNTLVRLRPNGTRELVAGFATQCVAWTAPFPNPIPDAANPCGTSEVFPAQPVPTDIAIGPDGDYYVSLLTGFPFTPGAARVWKVEAGRSTPATCSTFAPVPNDGCEIYAHDLTSLVSLDFGPDGRLYAVQIADDGVLALETGGSTAGSVQVLPPGGGSPMTSIDGLTAPGGVAVSGDDIYVTNFSIFPETGQLLRTSTP